MKELVTLLRECNLTIASCESLSGGLFAAKLVEIPGVSSVFVGSVVTYATRIKHEVVYVKQNTIDEKGVVSAEVANEMAENIAALMKSDIGVSFTGNAGPDVMEGKPAGLVYSSIFYKGKIVSYEDMISGTRNEVRNQIVDLMTQRLITLISKEKQNG
ncbi:MAG: nicotinamide-nucleotide amidohydrolase family protein [Erysipelotrichales bacterium]|nr:nicotinamide-nucleotide amidohydrolase family protein [Erysipelotrichales bacterium]